MARLKTALWIAAERKLCDRSSLPVVVVRKGHEEAGMVLVKLVSGRTCKVFSQSRDLEGRLGWRSALGDDFVPEGDADDYLSRQIRMDPDVWILEVDDPKGDYQPSQFPEQ